MDAEERTRLRARVEAWRRDADGRPRAYLDPGALTVAWSLAHEVLPLLDALEAAEAEAARYRDALEDAHRALVGIRDECRAFLAATEPEGQ